jgi:hypothetical protein
MVAVNWQQGEERATEKDIGTHRVTFVGGVEDLDWRQYLNVISQI